MEALFDENPLPLMFVEKDGKIIEFNKAFRSWSGINGDFTGKKLDEFTIPVSETGGNAKLYYFNLPSGQKQLVELHFSDIKRAGQAVQLVTFKEILPDIQQVVKADHSIFKAIFDKALDMIIITDDHGQIIHVNHTTCTKLGYSEEELLNMQIADFFSRNELTASVERENKYNSVFDEGFDSLNVKDGSSIYVEYRTVADIQPGRHLSVLRDRTHEKELEYQNQLNDFALNALINGIAFLDDHFRLTYVNQACLKMWGYSDEQAVLGSYVKAFFNDDSHFGDIKNKLLEKGEWAGQLLGVRANGKGFEVYATVRSFKTGNGSSSRWMASFMDISELMKTKRSLNKTQTRLKKLLEAAPDSVLVVNGKGEVVFCNKKTNALLGYTGKELLGQSVNILMPERFREKHDQYLKRFFENPVQRPMGTGGELFALKKDGTELCVDIMLGPLQEGKETYVLAIIRDVSNYKKAIDDLEKEKNYVQLLRDLAIIDKGVNSLEDVIRESINKLCCYLGWPVGHAWLPSSKGKRNFVSTGIWCDNEDDRFDVFRNVTLQTRFRAGLGAVGHVMETGKPHWIENVQDDPDFVRTKYTELDVKVRAGIFIPVLEQGRVVAILEFFNEKAIPRNNDLLEKLSIIGTQIGRLIERYRAQKNILKSEEKFKTLFNTARDAIVITDGKQCLDCNLTALNFFNSSTSQMKGSRFIELFTENRAVKETEEDMIQSQLSKALANKPCWFEWSFVPTKEDTVRETEVYFSPMMLDGEHLVQVLIRDVTKERKAEMLFKRNLNLFTQLFKNAPIGLIMLNKEYKIEQVNHGFTNIFGYTQNELIGKELGNTIVPGGQERDSRSLTEKAFRGDSFQNENVRIHKDGSERYVLIAAVPVEIEGSIEYIFGVYVDITEQKSAEDKVRKSLDEKVALLQEIHHRVKNNLAVVHSLLDFQKMYSSDPELKKALLDCQSRIRTMALIHEQLYQVEEFSSLAMDMQITKLTEALLNSYKDDRDISVITDLDTVEVPMKTALPLGLLVNELFSNCLKHAFVGRESGTIKVELKKEGDQIHLSIADDGVGMPEHFLSGNEESLGMTLINILCKQLNAQLSSDSSEFGTTFKTNFTLED